VGSITGLNVVENVFLLLYGWEADHSSPSSAEITKMELHLHSSICLRGRVLN
jgi:hypothetical protein